MICVNRKLLVNNEDDISIFFLRKHVLLNYIEQRTFALIRGVSQLRLGIHLFGSNNVLQVTNNKEVII